MGDDSATTSWNFSQGSLTCYAGFTNEASPKMKQMLSISNRRQGSSRVKSVKLLNFIDVIRKSMERITTK